MEKGSKVTSSATPPNGFFSINSVSLGQDLSTRRISWKRKAGWVQLRERGQGKKQKGILQKSPTRFRTVGAWNKPCCYFYCLFET